MVLTGGSDEKLTVAAAQVLGEGRVVAAYNYTAADNQPLAAYLKQTGVKVG